MTLAVDNRVTVLAQEFTGVKDWDSGMNYLESTSAMHK